MTRQDKIIGVIPYAVLSFAFFIIVFIAMAEYLALAVIVYLTGIIFRIFVHRERKEKFPMNEVLFYAVMLFISLAVILFISH
ncbi:MAG: hypothetical protein A2Y62_00795 [Candidatus Fischerbacteria bacterium RBG_13_37_8]|uniref:Uncharacterized protein n=1 Tax=Candidatus Fischerbacteria bacterium RBG_13_37_8 TaxID=1817863 RepID=A0A1F5VLS7_9BACT|nr:MAG: hypothetical protein A2Y62_00795 [Candidatus Fischerbacteria bacterium RBG_13_37_8]